MYNALSNFPVSRAFVTQPFTASVEFTPQEVEKMTRTFSRDQLRTADVTTGTIDQSVRISDVKFYYPDEETSWIFERLNRILLLSNEHLWNFDLNGYESFQYTEYHASRGGKYDYHADLFYGDMPSGTDPQTRKLSLSLI